MKCYKCGKELEIKRFEKFCPECRQHYGKYAHWWPSEDETIKDTGSVVYWSKLELYKDLRTNPTTAVPVACGMCKKSRLVPCSNIKMSLKKTGRYTGICRPCTTSSNVQVYKESLLKKSGRFTNSDGYVFVNIATLSADDLEFARHMLNATGRGNYVAEHRLVVAKRLGRPLLQSERVHHLNGIKNDNRPENLMLTDAIEHNHIEVRAYNELTEENRLLQEKIKLLESNI